MHLVILLATQAASKTLFFNFDDNLSGLFEYTCERGQNGCIFSANHSYNVIADALASLQTPVNGTSIKYLFSALVNATLDLVPYSTFVRPAENAYKVPPNSAEQYNLTTDRCMFRISACG